MVHDHKQRKENSELFNRKICEEVTLKLNAKYL